MGFGPWAPGTWGALLAVILFALGLSRVGLPIYASVIVLLSVLGVWASAASEAWFGKHDDGRIVIDEVVGQLIALAPLVPLQELELGRLGISPTAGLEIDLRWLLLVVTAFVAFRWFDIRKPGPVKWAEDGFHWGQLGQLGQRGQSGERGENGQSDERGDGNRPGGLPGGMGVMADDIVAGMIAAVVVMVPAYFAALARLRELAP